MVRQRIGHMRGYFERSGNERYVDMLVAAQALFDLLPHHKQMELGRRIGVDA